MAGVLRLLYDADPTPVSARSDRSGRHPNYSGSGFGGSGFGNYSGSGFGRGSRRRSSRRDRELNEPAARCRAPPGPTSMVVLQFLLSCAWQSLGFGLWNWTLPPLMSVAPKSNPPPTKSMVSSRPGSPLSSTVTVHLPPPRSSPENTTTSATGSQDSTVSTRQNSMSTPCTWSVMCPLASSSEVGISLNPNVKRKVSWPIVTNSTPPPVTLHSHLFSSSRSEEH